MNVRHIISTSIRTALLGSICLAIAGVSATGVAAAAPTAKATPRVIEITANDQMKYNLATIQAKAGEELKIILKNVGVMPKEAMGHNWVLLRSGSDAMAFCTAAIAAKDSDYIPAKLKGQVIAATTLIGPGKSDEVTFTVPPAGEYPFVCSFPAHFMAGMKGTLISK